MLRKCTDEDISDEECEKVINPFYDNYHAFVEEYIIPEVIATILLMLSIEMPCGKLLSYNIIILHLTCLTWLAIIMKKLRLK